MALRVAITAAGSGIGLAVARAFAARGDDVHLCDVDPAAVAAAAREGLTAQAVDVADLPALDAWIDGVLDAMGGLDVLVNNAGIAGPTALIEDVSAADWERCLAVGLTSHYRTCARVIPAMKAARSGSIVNISSTAGQHGLGMRTPYAAAKWAVIGLTKSIAIELGAHNVRANAICPGSVDGERMRSVIEREAAARGAPVDDVTREYVGGQSIARWVQPEEIADMCVFLASDAARMVTGQAIAVDGHTETFHIG
ncbi:MAG TPA: SDR family oxidoreductase [Gaiellales bacterium]|jgi:NAD(P)-dependent dehydrogenase (short-subunit alcohol dehydrogenase family)|nr:SDR family oxidoreductase [Gaiellales bacterium]